MKVPDESRLDEVISISGMKMQTLAKQGAHLCPPNDIPTDLLEANCIPSGFILSGDSGKGQVHFGAPPSQVVHH